MKMKNGMKGLVIFLAFMWVCTIVSKSVYVSNLPQVQVATPAKKYIEHVIETEGMVIAGEKQAINTLAGLRIAEIKVREGDYVEAGNLLFLFDLEDLEKIIAKKESELMKLQYQLADMKFNQILESQKKEIVRLWAYEDYEIAEEESVVAITRAQEALSKAQDNLKRHMGTKMPDYSSEESEYDAWQEKKSMLEDSVHSAKQGIEDAVRNGKNLLLEKIRETANAEVLSPKDSNMDVQMLDIANMEKELSVLYEIQKQKGEVKATKAGYIEEIQITVGNRTSDTAAILFTDDTQPCQFEFTITKEDGKYLHLEDEIEIKVKDSKMEVTVDYMKGNNVGGYDVICRLPENVKKPGLNGTVRKVEQGEVHCITVPSEAVKEEGKNHFVYILKEKMGILGNEYYAEKIKVEIEDQNERLIALKEGIINSEMLVIVSSSKEIKQGDIVSKIGIANK